MIVTFSAVKFYFQILISISTSYLYVAFDEINQDSMRITGFIEKSHFFFLCLSFLTPVVHPLHVSKAQ